MIFVLTSNQYYNIKLIDNMKTLRIQYLEDKVNFYMECLNTCHESMSDFYYEKVKSYQLLIADIKNGDQV